MQAAQGTRTALRYGSRFAVVALFLGVCGPALLAGEAAPKLRVRNPNDGVGGVVNARFGESGFAGMLRKPYFTARLSGSTTLYAAPVRGME